MSGSNDTPTTVAHNPSPDGPDAVADICRRVRLGEQVPFGPYTIHEQLGAGGMGVVFRAVDTRLGRTVVLKMMLPLPAAAGSDGGKAGPTLKQRFVREGRAAAAITSDHVVTIYEADERDGVAYIAMQFLKGEPLTALLTRRGRLPVADLLRVAREAALGLGAAHELGIVHRDIKPDNLWLEAPSGRVKVIDFGLARETDANDRAVTSSAILGTAPYMSLEQARGHEVDGRADLFSLGVTLYQIATGRLPFTGRTAMDIWMAMTETEPRPVRELNPDVPGPLADLIRRMLARGVADRVQTAAEVVARVDAVLAAPVVPPPPVAPPPAPSPPVAVAPPPPPSVIDRLPFGAVTIGELLALKSDPRAAAPLAAHAAVIWPVVKAAALEPSRGDVRRAFADLLAAPDRVAELWGEAVAAVKLSDRRGWSSRWAVLHEAARAEARRRLSALLSDDGTADWAADSPTVRSMLMVACSNVGLPPSAVPAPPPARSAVRAAPDEDDFAPSRSTTRPVSPPPPAAPPPPPRPVAPPPPPPPVVVPLPPPEPVAWATAPGGDQFYVTACAAPDSVLGAAGYTVRAASGYDQGAIADAARYPTYELPIDMWRDAPPPTGAPRRLALTDNPHDPDGAPWVAHSAYLQYDGHSSFTHLLALPSADPLAVLRSWGAAGWAREYPPGAPKQLPPARLPAGKLVSDATLTAFLGDTPPGPTELSVTVCPPRLRTSAVARRDLFARVLQAVLLLDAEPNEQRRRLYVHAEPGLLALMLYGAFRLLPTDVTEGLTFTTFEPYHRNIRNYKLAAVVGTYLGAPDKGLDSDLATARGIALDTFAAMRSSAPLRGPLPPGVTDLVELAARYEWKLLEAVHQAVGGGTDGLPRVRDVTLRVRGLSKIDDNTATIDEVLAIQEEPWGRAALTARASRVWPRVKEAALDPRRADVRKAFADWLSERDQFKEIWEEAVAAILKENFREWDSRWALLREVPGRDEAKKLLNKFVGSERNEDRLSRLVTDIRAKMRAACADVELFPPRPLLVPVGVGELASLFGASPDQAGYTAFVILASDKLGWLDHLPAGDRTSMRKRARDFLFAAPPGAIAAYVHAARPYLDTDPAFLEALFRPYSAAGAALMDKLLTTTALEPRDWMKLCVVVGLTQDKWGEFLLEKDRLANLLVGLGGDGTGAEVWDAYLGLLTNALVSPDLITTDDGTDPQVVHDWERKVHNHLKTAAERLTAAGHRLTQAMPRDGFRRLYAANNLLKWVDKPATAERDGPEEVKHACETFEIDRLDLVRVAYKKGYDRLDLPAQLAQLEPIIQLFTACFPVDSAYHTARTAVTQWLKLSQDCPPRARAMFQAAFVTKVVPDNHYEQLLGEQRQCPFEPYAVTAIRQASSPKRGGSKYKLPAPPRAAPTAEDVGLIEEQVAEETGSGELPLAEDPPARGSSKAKSRVKRVARKKGGNVLVLGCASLILFVGFALLLIVLIKG